MCSSDLVNVSSKPLAVATPSAEKQSHGRLKRKHQRTLEPIFSHPVSGTFTWRDIEALFQELGEDVSGRKDSLVAAVLFGEVRVFHRAD